MSDSEDILKAEREPLSEKFLQDVAKEAGMSTLGLKEAFLSAAEEYDATLANIELNLQDRANIEALQPLLRSIKSIIGHYGRIHRDLEKALQLWDKLDQQAISHLHFYHGIMRSAELDSVPDNLRDLAATHRVPRSILDARTLIEDYIEFRTWPNKRPNKGENSGLYLEPLREAAFCLSQVWRDQHEGKEFRPRLRDESDKSGAGKLLQSLATWLDNRHTLGDCVQVAEHMLKARQDAAQAK